MASTPAPSKRSVPSIKKLKAYKEAMEIFEQVGAPDLFITFTANRDWPEITKKLGSIYTPDDSVKAVCQVFNEKLKSLVDDLTVGQIFGRVEALVYTIEYQFYGNPHAHILVTLCEEEKFKNAKRIDEFVSAELPNKDKDGGLYDIVKKFMIQSYEGENSDKKHPSKVYPKALQPTTAWDKDGNPLYKRRGSGEPTEFKHKNNRRVRYDSNQCVVPYNGDLLLKYNAHINVEVCNRNQESERLCIYIFKRFKYLKSYNDNQKIYDAAWKKCDFPLYDKWPREAEELASYNSDEHDSDS